MLEILSGLSAVAGIFALISPKTPIAKNLLNKIGIKNEILEKYHSSYQKVILFITFSIIMLVFLSSIAYFDYSKYVLFTLYMIMFSGLFTILSIYDRIVTRKKKANTPKLRFFSSYGNKPLIVLISTLLISFILLSTATSIFESKEMTYLYRNLKNNNVSLNTLISNQKLNKEEFANKYENIVKLTQKAQLMQDYERYYKEGIEFNCNPKIRNTNHSKVERDMFTFLCENFDEKFIDIYIPQLKEAYFIRRTGLSPETYPLNWLTKSTENQSYRLSRLILNIRITIGNCYLFVKNKFHSIINIAIGFLILTVCYFIAHKFYHYNKKYDEEAVGPTFIFYAIFSMLSFFTFIWSISI